MMHKITNDQMKNLILNELFKRKSDARRTAHNITVFLSDCPKATVRDALEFELQGRYCYEDDKKGVFHINNDYSTVNFECDDLEKAIDMAHEHLLQIADWYRALVK